MLFMSVSVDASSDADYSPSSSESDYSPSSSESDSEDESEYQNKF